MKICAVICELNPLHSGHRYIFEKAKETSRADRLIAVMSGNFVQRALPAVIGEYARAECALKCGADAVIELPAIYATASGDKFADGAIRILNTIPGVTHLVMGTESQNKDLLAMIADIQSAESERFKASLNSYLKKNGSSYARALTAATADEADLRGLNRDEIISILCKPNNILAISYKKALLSSGSGIEFLPVTRVGGEISETFSGKYSSASAIRNNISDDKIKEAMPGISYDIMMREIASCPVNRDVFSALIINALRDARADEIGSTPDCAEGIENKIKQLAEMTASYNELLSKVSTVRFTKGRIMRICLHTLLKITKEMQSGKYDIARLLGVKKDSSDLLSILPENIITNKRSEKNIPTQYLPCFETEKRAASIYSLLTKTGGSYFYRKLQIAD